MKGEERESGRENTNRPGAAQKAARQHPQVGWLLRSGMARDQSTVVGQLPCTRPTHEGPKFEPQKKWHGRRCGCPGLAAPLPCTSQQSLRRVPRPSPHWRSGQEPPESHSVPPYSGATEAQWALKGESASVCDRNHCEQEEKRGCSAGETEASQAGALCTQEQSPTPRISE